MRRISRLAVVILLLVATGLFQAWFMGIRVADATHRDPLDLVDTYTQALAYGKSNIGIADAERSVVDASYFGGRIYLYYGIAPFVLLLVPWFKVTGTFLAPSIAIWSALVVGYAANGVSLLLLCRHDGRARTGWLLAAGFVTIVVGSDTWCLMEMANIHQLEAAWGYACTSLSIAGLVAGWVFPQRRIMAGCVATGCAGLIMACRPNCFSTVCVLAGLAGMMCWENDGGAGKKWRRAIVVAVPLLVVAVALAAWNFARFGNSFEFGMKYGTGALGRPNILGFSWGNIFYNLHRYLFGGFRSGNYFPFIDGVKEGPLARPEATHESVDQVYGCLLLLPILLFAGLSLRKNKIAGGLLLSAAVGDLFFLSGLGFGSYRYAVDFFGVISFLAAVGVCSVAEIASGRNRIFVVVSLAGLLAYSAAAALCQATSIARVHGLLDMRRPRDFAALAFPFNRVVYGWEKISHAGPTGVRFTLTLPNNKYGKAEPLLVTGESGLQDFLYFYYTAPGLIQMGFESMGQGGPVSAAMRSIMRNPTGSKFSTETCCRPTIMRCFAKFLKAIARPRGSSSP